MGEQCVFVVNILIKNKRTSQTIWRRSVLRKTKDSASSRTLCCGWRTCRTIKVETPCQRYTARLRLCGPASWRTSGPRFRAWDPLFGSWQTTVIHKNISSFQDHTPQSAGQLVYRPSSRNIVWRSIGISSTTVSARRACLQPASRQWRSACRRSSNSSP
jgi:hypothetical protein